MSDQQLIDVASAARRAKLPVHEFLLGYVQRHGIEVVTLSDGTKAVAVGALSKALDPVDSEVRDLLSGETRQRKERERSREDIQRHVRSTLEGSRPPTASNEDRDKIPNLVGDKSKSKPSKGDQLLGLIGTRREGQTDAEIVRKWLDDKP